MSTLVAAYSIDHDMTNLVRSPPLPEASFLLRIQYLLLLLLLL